jgi:site-specific recombinase XerD
MRKMLSRDSVISWKNARTRAAIELSWSAAIRLSELIKLDVGDLADRVNTKKWRIKEAFLLGPEKAKKYRSKGVLSSASGKIRIPTKQREIVRYYIYSAQRAKIFPKKLSEKQPLFVNQSRNRISKRMLEKNFSDLQKRLGIVDEHQRPVYRWHDLRHTAITRISEAGANAFEVMNMSRIKSTRNVMRYLHPSDARVIELIEKGSR